MRLAPRSAKAKERGTLIVALMAGIAIVMILSTVAVQNWADVVRRDNEAEMMFRAQDIVRSIKRFQADKGRLPAELKELMEPGQKGQFILRHLWKDPLVKGGAWQLVYAAPGGGLYDPTVQPNPQQGGTKPGGLGGLGGTQPGGTQPGGAQPGGAQPGALGTSLSGAQGDTGAFPPIGGADAKGGIGADPTGFPIAGVKTKCKDKPFRKWKEKTEYSDWVFSIFDLEQQRPNPGTGLQNPAGSAAFPPQSSPQQVPPPGQPAK